MIDSTERFVATRVSENLESSGGWRDRRRSAPRAGTAPNSPRPGASRIVALLVLAGVVVGSSEVLAAGAVDGVGASGVAKLRGGAASGLPDSGQTLCYDGTATLVACTSANSGDTAPYPRQDGRFGRDAKATAGTLTKIGGGAAGFDYTKMANNGTDLAADAALGTGATDWACTRDNVTGLTWEVKTAGANTDLRYFGHQYSWYSTDATTNGGDAGSTGRNTCNSTLAGGLCNTQAYVAAVNAAALCGYTDWRLPSYRELTTLVHGGTVNPSIDVTYFPNTPASLFWSSSSFVNSSAWAWFVYFIAGDSDVEIKQSSGYARLVRGGQF